MKYFFVYIMANHKRGTIYAGVTSNLQKRVWEHKNDIAEGFTKIYKLHKLVFFEQTENAYSAIQREKKLKKWKRDWKIKLIEENNPDWRDLYDDLME